MIVDFIGMTVVVIGVLGLVLAAGAVGALAGRWIVHWLGVAPSSNTDVMPSKWRDGTGMP